MSNTLSDTQRIVLSTASMRDDGAVLPLPRSAHLNAGSVAVVLRSLLARTFVHERPAKRDEPSWRETESGERLGLVISEAGCAAIGVEPAHLAQLDLPLTIQPEPKGTEPDQPPAKAPSKLECLVAAMSGPDGATIAELIDVTSWQAHSIRGAIAGALKKRGLAIVSEKIEGRGRVYRVARPTDQSGEQASTSELAS